MPANYESQYIPEPNSGCWLWLGQINQFGYGRVRIAGRTQVAHRAVYEAHHGTTVPVELQLDHLCNLRCCVNPDHLEPVTRIENVRRAVTRRGSKTTCPNGHEMTGDNIWVRKDGKGQSVVCRACARKARTKYRLAHKAAV